MSDLTISIEKINTLTATFLDTAFLEITKIGLNLKKFSAKLDHIAWQCNSTEEYNKLKPSFEKFCELVREPIISERRVGVFKLFKPLVYDNQEV